MGSVRKRGLRTGVGYRDWCEKGAEERSGSEVSNGIRLLRMGMRVALGKNSGLLSGTRDTRGNRSKGGGSVRMLTGCSKRVREKSRVGCCVIGIRRYIRSYVDWRRGVVHLGFLHLGNEAAFSCGELLKAGQACMLGESFEVGNEMLQIDFRLLIIIVGQVGRGVHADTAARLHLVLGLCDAFAALGGEHIQRELEHAGGVQLQAAAYAAENVVHDLVAADAAGRHFLLSCGHKLGRRGAGLQPGGVQLLRLRYPVLVQYLSGPFRVTVQLLQYFIAESDGFFSGLLLASVLFVGEIARHGSALAADGNSPTLEVGERIGESCYVTQIHSAWILFVHGAGCNSY